MKANKEFRPVSKEETFDSGDLKKGKKLTPDKKPKNEKKELYDVEDFDEDYDFLKFKRESIADFYDDGDESEDEDVDDDDSENEDFDEEFDDEEDETDYEEEEEEEEEPTRK
jgi:hypothetical protein